MLNIPSYHTSSVWQKFYYLINVSLSSKHLTNTSYHIGNEVNTVYNNLPLSILPLHKHASLETPYSYVVTEIRLLYVLPTLNISQVNSYQLI